MERYYQKEIECASPGADPDMAGRAARPSGASCVGQCALLPRKDGGGARCAGRYQGPGRSLQAAVFEQSRSAWEAYPFGLLAEPLEKCIRIHSTSGTTGKRVVAFYTKEDIDLWNDCCARALAARGCRPGGCMSGRVWLRPVHRRLRTQRRQSEARLPDAADVLRQHRPAAAIYGGSRFDRFVLHTVLRGVSG